MNSAEGDGAEWILLLAPQARECCLTRGSIAIWTMLAAKCVFLVHVCVNVCLHRRIATATALFGCSFPSCMSCDAD